MMRKSGVRAAAVLASLTFVLSCSGDRAADVERWTGEPTIAPAWLRAQLPVGTLAYVRVPHPLGMLAMPKGGTFDAALGSAANQTAVANVRRGLVDNVLDRLPGGAANPLVALAVDKLKSPLEIAAMGQPAIGVLVGATVDLDSNAELEAWVAAAQAAELPIALAAPLDAGGIGELMGLPVPAFLHFDAATGRLLVLASPTATAETIRQAAAAGDAAHAMHEAEARVDTSSQGLFAWVDVRGSLPLSQGLLPLGPGVPLSPLGNARSIALGAGNANGKGRFAVLVDVPGDIGPRPFPLVSNPLTATTAGAPDAVFLLSLPSREELTRLETLALSMLPPPAQGGWNETKTAFRDATGVALEEIFAAVGPEILAIMDEAGDYVGVHLRDAALFDDIVRRLAAKTGTAPVTRTVDGATYSHWTLPSSTLALPATQVPEVDGLDSILARVGTHLHWTRDGDYLYFAGVPQPLLDRARSSSLTSLNAWLSETQRVDLSTSLVGATGAVAKSPRRMYHAYLGALRFLSDVSGVELDLFAMPTADDLALPDEGSIGLALSLGDPYVSLELTYEAHPGELLLGAGGMASVATVGILAAIAIPAYQDYTVRGSVAAALTQAGGAQVAVANHLQREGRLPSGAEVAALRRDPVPPVAYIDVEGGSGKVILGFGADAPAGAGEITLTPQLTAEGRIIASWSCTSTLAPKYLPAACR